MRNLHILLYLDQYGRFLLLLPLFKLLLLLLLIVVAVVRYREEGDKHNACLGYGQEMIEIVE